MSWGGHHDNYYGQTPAPYPAFSTPQSFLLGTGYSFATPSVGPPPSAPQQTYQNLRPGKCRLEVRQQPVEALCTTHGKEKARKPLDPPPVVALVVDEDLDPSRLYMNSPNLFCMIHLCGENDDKPHRFTDKKNELAMVGTLCSSVHRLKEGGTGEPENAFFIFGDVSVRLPGTWRLRFTLYDIPFGQNTGQSNGGSSRWLHTAFSQPFQVVHSKEFKGLGESTPLTRAFSDQGVRLRLRKEQRQTKRKVDERSPSLEPDSSEIIPLDKRQRYEEFAESTDFSAGPVQPHHDAQYITGTLQPMSESTVYSAGPVQPSSTPSNSYHPYMTPTSLQSRYQERVQQEYNLLGGYPGHNFSTTSYSPF